MFAIVLVVIVALIFGGFYYWARRQGLLTTDQAVEGEQGARRISLLTEAVAYIGAILLLAGGAAAIGQRWNGITDWGRVGVFTAAAVFFLLVGIIVRQVREPAIQRLVGVVWFLSVAGVAGAVGFATHEVYRHTGAGGGGSAPSLAFALALWIFGLAWAGLGWQRYVEPLWVSIPSGVVLALIAPSLTAGEHGWAYAIGIATATVAMAASIPLRNTPLLALGTLAMFGYVTSVAVRYFHESLGVPAALAITGVLIIGLAVISARLMRATHPPKPNKPGAEKPSYATLPPKLTEPGAEKRLFEVGRDGVTS